MSIEWDRGLIIYVPFAPFGHDAFAFPLLGLPGAMLIYDDVKESSPIRQHCLKKHERMHWIQWSRVFIPTFVVVLFAVAATDMPWWVLLATPYVWHVAYFLGGKERWSAEAQQVQRDCLRGGDTLGGS